MSRYGRRYSVGVSPRGTWAGRLRNPRGGRPPWSHLGALFEANAAAGSRLVIEALEQTGGNVERAAHVLGVTGRQLRKRLWKHGLWVVADRCRRDAAARAPY